MKKQLDGIAFILFGLLLIALDNAGGIWIPIIDALPWKVLGLISGAIGMLFVLIPPKKN